MNNGDKIFKFLQKCNSNCNVPDLHSFNANIKGGRVFVECRGNEVYILIDTNSKSRKWVGTTVAAANLLDNLEMDYQSIDM